MSELNLEWCEPRKLFDTKDHLAVGGKSGVYRIRAFQSVGHPLRIPRLNGIDPLGVLHIGKSKNWGRRIRTFRQAAEGLKAAHHGGCEFHQWGFSKIIPYEWLYFDYAITGSEKDALSLERKLHEEYRKLYFDRPPLDGTSGQSDE